MLVTGVFMLPEILYRDEYLLAVNKPEALLSVPGIGPDKQDCVISRILTEYPEAKIVHRLDCYTSGIMLLALGIEVQRELSRQFHDREIDKSYEAVVHGKQEQQEGMIDLPMRCDIDDRPRQIIDFENGKSAVTHWKVLGYENDCTRLQLMPVTGRTHQLRLHCKAMGYPIVGDRLYGDEGEQVEGRMQLHAKVIEFTHPQSRQRIRLQSECDF